MTNGLVYGLKDAEARQMLNSLFDDELVIDCGGASIDLINEIVIDCGGVPVDAI
jgi:hypothetical protein